MRYSANMENYELVRLYGNEVIFSVSRIDPLTVPDGYYLYEVRYDDDNFGYPVEISNRIIVNFFGSVISNRPLDNNRLYINDANDWEYVSKPLSLDEYMRMYPS